MGRSRVELPQFLGQGLGSSEYPGGKPDKVWWAGVVQGKAGLVGWLGPVWAGQSRI